MNTKYAFPCALCGYNTNKKWHTHGDAGSGEPMTSRRPSLCSMLCLWGSRACTQRNRHAQAREQNNNTSCKKQSSTALDRVYRTTKRLKNHALRSTKAISSQQEGKQVLVHGDRKITNAHTQHIHQPTSSCGDTLLQTRSSTHTHTLASVSQ